MNDPYAPLSTAPLRNGDALREIVSGMQRCATRQWRIMEVCGGQTFTLARYRLEELFPPGITMIHGPGCPVCVTPEATIDAAIALAQRSDVALCSFGDMLRVPGSEMSLLDARSAGADVRLLYSPLDMLAMAMKEPERQFVFFAIGFETTAPLYAVLVEKAAKLGVNNLSLLTSLYRVPPIVESIVADPQCRVDALVAAGHVCAVTGLEEYESLAERLQMPVVVGGFEPVELAKAIARAAAMLERGETGVVNEYPRVVAPGGNPVAMQMINRVFEPADAVLRGIGTISGGGLKLRPELKQFDALSHFDITPRKRERNNEPDRCLAATIMKGGAAPADCPLFGGVCTPQHPAGAPMVSSEGVCAAHYRYRNHTKTVTE